MTDSKDCNDMPLEFDRKMNAVKFGSVDSESFKEKLQAWYFHDRGSLLIGKKYEFEFDPAFSVSGSLITDVTDGLDEEFDSELEPVGRALKLARDLNSDILSVRQSVVFALRLYGFNNNQIGIITNLNDGTVATHYERARKRLNKLVK